MSNYAHGNIRLRGKRENILKFLQDELCTQHEDIEVCDADSIHVTREERPIHMTHELDGYITIITRDPDTNPWFYFKNVDRCGQFLSKHEEKFDIEWEEKNNLHDDQVVAIDDFEARYETVEEDYFSKMATKYKVDIRIFLLDYESGYSGVDTYTFFRNGQRTVTSTVYKDRLWEAPVYYWA